jgi:hypothetical protein
MRSVDRRPMTAICAKQTAGELWFAANGAARSGRFRLISAPIAPVIAWSSILVQESSFCSPVMPRRCKQNKRIR